VAQGRPSFHLPILNSCSSLSQSVQSPVPLSCYKYYASSAASSACLYLFISICLDHLGARCNMSKLAALMHYLSAENQLRKRPNRARSVCSLGLFLFFLRRFFCKEANEPNEEVFSLLFSCFINGRGFFFCRKTHNALRGN